MTEEQQTSPPMAPRVSAGALFVNERDRVLLVESTDKSYWDVPGGYVEPGESPLAACVREEPGIEPPIGPLLVVDWAPAEKEGDKLLFIFAGGTLTSDKLAAIHLQADELRSYEFRDLADADAILIPRLARRLAVALDAYRTGETRYIEHGVVPAAPLPELADLGSRTPRTTTPRAALRAVLGRAPGVMHPILKRARLSGRPGRAGVGPVARP